MLRVRSWSAVGAIVLAGAVAGEAAVTVALEPSAPASDVVASYTQYDTGGNTSVKNDAGYKWKYSGATPAPAGGWGYFLDDATHTEVPYMNRARDLGQTFTVSAGEARWLRSITVRTGFGDNVVRANTYGGSVAIQLFGVTGSPILDDNGSSSGNTAYHGFPHGPYGTIPHERDDYYTGETYAPIALATGGVFPSKEDFGVSGTVDPNDAALKGRFVRFRFDGAAPLLLQPGGTYAFMLMLEDEMDDNGFTLANRYAGGYAGGHGIRREGNGTYPPPTGDVQLDPTHPDNAEALAGGRLPVDMSVRAAIPPGTNGYPDVDTYRDVAFWVQAPSVLAVAADPVVAFTNPADGGTVAGAMSVSVTAVDPNAGSSDGDGIDGVAFTLTRDGRVVAEYADASPAYAWPVDTALFADGSYALTAVATGSAAAGGTSSTVSVAVTLANSLSDDADADSDGLPDWWETLFFGDAQAAEASADADADGASNLDEYLSLTDPQDPTSRPADDAGGLSCAAARGAGVTSVALVLTAAYLLLRRGVSSARPRAAHERVSTSRRDEDCPGRA